MSRQLKTLQHAFLKTMYSDTEESVLSARIKSKNGLDGSQRLGIYKNSSRAILRQHLKQIYPVCVELMGEKSFLELANYYLQQHAAETPFIRDYGDKLSNKMQTHKTLKGWLWIADIARLEWARHHAWHNANQMISNWQKLSHLDETEQAKVRFRLPESATLIDSNWAIHSIWLAHQKDSSTTFESIQLEQPCYLMIYRQNREIIQHPLTEPELRFLQRIYQGKRLEELLDLYQEETSILLQKGIENSWILSYSLHSK